MLTFTRIACHDDLEDVDIDDKNVDIDDDCCLSMEL